MMAFLHPCATPGLSLMAGRCSIEEIHRGQQGTPAVTLPHRRDGLHVLWMAVLCPFRRCKFFLFDGTNFPAISGTMTGWTSGRICAGIYGYT